MELRSSRSRSKTPFTQVESFDKELIEKEYHAKAVVRATRRTTVFKTNDGATSSTEEIAYVKPMRRSTRTEKNVKRLYRTSDYSSEDGENEVSSTRTISQNEKNQILEDAKAAANGSAEVSALNLYKKSGRYWDIYPKTDWTYSYHSKDRVELAPGIVAMPNMSRKTIHSVHEMDGSSYSHKETNTDSYMKTSTYGTSSDPHYNCKPRLLFNNNTYSDAHGKHITHSSWSSWWYSLRKSVSKVISVTIFHYILSVFYYSFEMQTRWFSKLHQLASKVMLLDTWLLWKTRNNSNKSTKLAILCLVPLILFGGWWILSSLGGMVYGAYFNSTSRDHISIDTGIVTDGKPAEELVEKRYMEFDAASLTSEQLKLLSKSLKQENDLIVENILISPSFQNIINNIDKSNGVLETQQKLIDDLKDQINRMKVEITDTEQNWKQHLSNLLSNLKSEMIQQHSSKKEGTPDDIIISQQKTIEALSNEIKEIKDGMSEVKENWQDKLNSFLTQIKAETMENNARLTYQLNKCCRKSIIDIESHISRVLSNLLNDPKFLQSQEGFSDYLRAIFVAKRDLEFTLLNLTHNLDTKYDSLVEENSKIIMDTVIGRIKTDMDEKIQKRRTGIVLDQKTDLLDDQVKQIVKEALDIYDADKTGLVDYAMEPMGGQILTTRCTENYHYGKAVVSVLGIPLWYPVNSPRTIITPSMHPGDCWAFQNFPGFVVIKLSNRVRIEAFSMEHISKLLIPNGKIDSAPKEFEVYGLTSEDDREPTKLGEYAYEYDGESIQFFPVQNEGNVFEIIELRITSNHGNPNYTCLYRFRVHGKLAHDSS